MSRRYSMVAVLTLAGLAVFTLLGPNVVGQWAMDDSMLQDEDVILGGSEPYIGQIMAVGFNFAPRGWAKCDGQLLPIAQNSALFSLLGTTFGGDGRTTFGLPDLRGRVAIGEGQGQGLSHRSWGERGGAETTTLTVNQMPAHNHDIFVEPGDGDTSSPTGMVLAQALLSNRRDNQYAILPDPAEDTLDLDAVSVVGGGQAHANMQPFLTINYCIALQGVLPSRN